VTLGGFACTQTPITWGNDINATSQLRISSFSATVTYALPDGEIFSVVPSGPPIPVRYAAQDVATVIARSLYTVGNPLAPDTHTSAELVTYLAQTISPDAIGDVITDQEQEKLRNFLAIPLYYINARRISHVFHARDINQLPANMSVTGYFAKDAYRIVYSLWSIVTFIVLACFTLVWSALVFLYCLISGGLPPNVSDYPEVDFASKIVSHSRQPETTGGLETLLKGLGNAKTGDLILRFRDKKIFIGEDANRVVLVSDTKRRALISGHKYY